MKKKVHEHKFKRAGMTLYCSCGYTSKIDCAHRWELHKKEFVSIERMGGEVSQNQETHFCKVCGAVLALNTTSGYKSITP